MLSHSVLFLFLKFSITVLRILVISAPAGWKEYLLYQGSLPPGIFKHFLASGIFLRASHIPEAVNEVAKHSNHQHVLNIKQTVQMAEQTTDMTEIGELHYPVKSRTLDRGALGVKNAFGTLRAWSGQWSAQEKCTGRKDSFKKTETMEKECGEAPESCLPKLYTGLCPVVCTRQGGYSSWPRSTCRNS